MIDCVIKDIFYHHITTHLIWNSAEGVFGDKKLTFQETDFEPWELWNHHSSLKWVFDSVSKIGAMENLI